MSRRPYTLRRRVRHLWQAALAALFFLTFRLLPLDAASDAGGWLGRKLGPRYKAHRIAKRNVDLIFPDRAEEEKRRILLGMWDNLGRTLGEFPHLGRKAMSARIRIEGSEHGFAAHNAGKTVLFIAGHFANWEIAPKSAHMVGVPLVLAYRPANNPYVDRLVHLVRGQYYSAMHAKGRVAARAFLTALQEGQAIAALLDQKLGEGISVPFMGRDAMTSTLAAQLALRHNVAVIPSRVVRHGGAHFVTHIYPEMIFERTGDMEADIRNATIAVNELFAKWIRENPSQWFFVHKRWANGEYKDM